MTRRAGAAYLTLAVADTALAVAGCDRYRRITKPLLMPALAVGRDRPTQLALGLSAAGDVALLGQGRRAFPTGLGAFLGAHLMWIRALNRRPGGGRVRGRPALALPYVVACVGLNAVLWRRTGRDRWPVVLYSAALTGAAVAALDTDDLPTAVGGVLFMVSDTLLALERFAQMSLPGHEAWVMSTYTAGLALLAGAAAGSRPGRHDRSSPPS